MDLRNTIHQIVVLHKMGKVVKNSWVNEDSEGKDLLFGNLKLGPVIISGCYNGNEANVFVMSPNNVEVASHEDYMRFLSEGGELINVTNKTGSWNEIITKYEKEIKDQIELLMNECNQEVEASEVIKDNEQVAKIGLAETICSAALPSLPEKLSDKEIIEG